MLFEEGYLLPSPATEMNRTRRSEEVTRMQSFIDHGVGDCSRYTHGRGRDDPGSPPPSSESIRDDFSCPQLPRT
jgi:hypothetical protein